jgi:hypothetical protein
MAKSSQKWPKVAKFFRKLLFLSKKTCTVGKKRLKSSETKETFEK